MSTSYHTEPEKRQIPQPIRRPPWHVARSANVRAEGVSQRSNTYAVDERGGARLITMRALGRKFEHYHDPDAGRGWRPGDALPAGAPDALGALIRHANTAGGFADTDERRAA